jgi:uncharacterized protein
MKVSLHLSNSSRLSKRNLVLGLSAGLLTFPSITHAEMFMGPRGTEGFSDAQARVFRAASWGNVDEVRRRASPGDLLSTTTASNETLLQRALKLRNRTALVTLLRAGANASQIGEFDNTVIHNGATYRDPKWLKLLLDNGADPNARDGNTDATPIMSAIMYDKIAQFKMLLAGGADLRLGNRTGNTPLHIAAQVNDFDRALDLLRAGADPRALNAQRATFQRYAFMTSEAVLNERASAGRQAVRAWLIQNGIALETA